MLALGEQLLLALVPGGGQRTARRNAWAGMSEASARGRARREADAALELAISRAQRPVARVVARR